MDVLGNTGDSVKNVKNILSMVFRVYDMMDYNSNEMKKQLTKKKNELWVTPKMEGMSQYAVKDMEKAYEQGYAATKENIKKIKKMLK